MQTMSCRIIILLLCLATLCQAQGNDKTSSSGAPPATATPTPQAKDVPKPDANKDKKETVPKSDDKKAVGNDQLQSPDKDQAKVPHSEVKCAIYINPEKPAPPSLRELQYLCPDSSSSQLKNIPNAGLGNDVFLWISLNGKGKVAGDEGELGITDLRLFIDEIEIDDSKASWVAFDDANAIVRVRLERPQSSKPAWSQVLANGLGFRNVRVTLGADKKKPLPSHAILGLYLMQLKWYFYLFLTVFVLLAALLLTNNRFKQMLRDDGPVKNGITAAYSLSRVQMAYWFALAITAYALIWGITGDRDTINNDILALIGISAGTFLGAVSIDASKKSQAQAELPSATAKLVEAQNIAATAPAATAPLANQAVVIQKDAVYRLSCQTMADGQNNFLSDILDDENGVSFHRFQIVAWNLVLA
jgi:hypothetical protein